MWREAHREKLPSVAGGVGGDEKVRKREAWTPQSIIYGIYINTGGSSLGDVMGTENDEKITELADQLKLQCLKETMQSMLGLVGYDISVVYRRVIPATGKGFIQAGLAVSLPSGVHARIAPRSGLVVKKFIYLGAGVIYSDYQGEIGVVLFNHLAVHFSVPGGEDRLAHPRED